jgi:hypothetical protein
VEAPIPAHLRRAYSFSANDPGAACCALAHGYLPPRLWRGDLIPKALTKRSHALGVNLVSRKGAKGSQRRKEDIALDVRSNL